MPETRWRAELERLNRILEVIAKTPFDMSDPNWHAKLEQMKSQSPLDHAGVRTEAETLMRDILEDYASASDDRRAAMRALVPKHSSYFWATGAPKAATAAGTLRLRLILFALVDQGNDPRDEVMYLDKTFAEDGVSSNDVTSLRREIAQMASDEDRYGFGSTRSMLLRGYGEYGRKNAPEGGKRSWIPWRK